MEIFNLGTIEFDEAYAFQRKILEETCAGLRAVSAIFCRHLPVFTLGRQASFNNIQASINELLEKKIKLRAIGRGGDVTYHGPGQLTVYPVVDLRFFRKDIHWYLRQLEELVLHTLTELGVQACRKKDLTGVWVKEKKICSIGIGIKNWVTFHGFTLNVKAGDLGNFELIKPCGMDIKMTSVENELGGKVDFAEITAVLTSHFDTHFAQRTYALQIAGGAKNDQDYLT